MKKADLIIIAVVILMAAVLLLIVNRIVPGYEVHYAVINSDGDITKVSLDINDEYTIRNDYGYNVLVINNRSCYIKDADCDNKICINTGIIHSSEETICCLPHRLLITLE